MKLDYFNRVKPMSPGPTDYKGPNGHCGANDWKRLSYGVLDTQVTHDLICQFLGKVGIHGYVAAGGNDAQLGGQFTEEIAICHAPDFIKAVKYL